MNNPAFGNLLTGSKPTSQFDKDLARHKTKKRRRKNKLASVMRLNEIRRRK